MTLPPDDAPEAGRFRRTLISVMTVQIATLIALWLMQRHFSA
jgi:hypothetical protein